MTHGIETTIVEIDPVVHEYATKYFGLPTNHKAVIEDAVSYAAELAQTEEKYDYIVNDVFTGGAEPVDLFTLEFLSDLNTILKPGGVIAIVSLPHYFLYFSNRSRTTPAIFSSPRHASSCKLLKPSSPLAASSENLLLLLPSKSSKMGETSQIW
jgi:spermidine synthase